MFQTTIIPKSLDANSTGNVIKAKQELPHIKIPTLIIDKNPHGISSKELRDNLDFKYLIQPISYNIYIKPNLKDHLDMSFEEFSFTAEASIIFRTREQLTYIILAAGELTIKKISLRELKNFDGDVRIINNFYLILMFLLIQTRQMMNLSIKKKIIQSKSNCIRNVPT